MPTSPYLQYYDNLVRSRAQLEAVQRQAQYVTQLAGQDRANSHRDLNLQLNQTDRTYMTPIISRGLGNSGYAGFVDSQYRQGVANQRASIEDAYLRAVNQAQISVINAQQQNSLDAMLLKAALDGTLTDETYKKILGGA